MSADRDAQTTGTGAMVRASYRAGQKNLRVLARQFGVSLGTVRGHLGLHSADRNRKNCRRKVRYDAFDAAEMKRVEAMGVRQDWGATEVYRCRVCDGFHFGRTRADG
jgi:hypothetical protein